MDYLGLIITFIVVFPAVFIGQVYVLGRKLSEPEKLIVELPEGTDAQREGTIARYSEWLASEKLQFRTAFNFQNILAVVFQHEDQPRFFSFLFHPFGVVFSAESYLEDLKILDTGNSRSIGMFPRPGAYAQSFPGAPAQEIWRKHLEGETYLAEKSGLKLMSGNRPYKELLIAATRVRMKYNRSQSFWPVRVLYRYFFVRHFLVNKTIAQQFP